MPCVSILQGYSNNKTSGLRLQCGNYDIFFIVKNIILQNFILYRRFGTAKRLEDFQLFDNTFLSVTLL